MRRPAASSRPTSSSRMAARRAASRRDRPSRRPCSTRNSLPVASSSTPDLLHRESDPPADLRASVDDVEARDRRPPGGGAHERAEHPDGRRLPRTVRPEQAEDLAGPTRTRCRAPPPCRPVALAQALDDDRVALVGRAARRGVEQPSQATDRSRLSWHRAPLGGTSWSHFLRDARAADRTQAMSRRGRATPDGRALRSLHDPRALAHPARRLGGDGDAAARRDGGQRRAAGDPRRPGRELRRAAVGDRRLRAHARGDAAHRRRARRPHRPASACSPPAWSCSPLLSALCGAASSGARARPRPRRSRASARPAMFATSLALLAHEFQGAERGFALGVWGAITGAALALGPARRRAARGRASAGGGSSW